MKHFKMLFLLMMIDLQKLTAECDDGNTGGGGNAAV